MRVNVKFMQMCASCQYWDDPSRSAMTPTVGKNMWEVNTSLMRLCIKRKVKMRAGSCCQQYKLKIGVF